MFRVEQRVLRELEAVLAWARAVRDSMDRFPDRRDELQSQGHAYVGGVLTTLGHLELINEDEHAEWDARLTGVLGDPPGGWVTLRSS